MTTFRGTSSTKTAGKFFECHTSILCPSLLDHGIKKVCTATWGSGGAPPGWQRHSDREALLCSTASSHSLHRWKGRMWREESHSLRNMSELISAGPGHPRGARGPGVQG